MLNAHLDLRGNAYAQIVRNRGGRIIRLVPIHPDRVQVKRVANYNSEGLRPIYYEVSNEAFGGVARLTDFDILHLRGYDRWVCGISPVRIKAETIGAAIAANTHASALFANGARPAGVLEHPAKLGDPGMENLRKSWQATHGGAQNSGKIAILEEGMKFHEVGLSNEDAQLLESRKYSRTEIAAMYRVRRRICSATLARDVLQHRTAIDRVRRPLHAPDRQELGTAPQCLAAERGRAPEYFSPSIWPDCCVAT